MSFNRGVDKNVAHIYSGIFLSHKRNEIMPLAEMWMDLEAIIQSRVSQKEKIYIVYINTYVDSRKMVQTNPFAKYKQRHRCREQVYGQRVGKGSVQ